MSADINLVQFGPKSYIFFIPLFKVLAFYYTTATISLTLEVIFRFK